MAKNYKIIGVSIIQANPCSSLGVLANWENKQDFEIASNSCLSLGVLANWENKQDFEIA